MTPGIFLCRWSIRHFENNGREVGMEPAAIYRIVDSGGFRPFPLWAHKEPEKIKDAVFSKCSGCIKSYPHGVGISIALLSCNGLHRQRDNSGRNWPPPAYP